MTGKLKRIWKWAGDHKAEIFLGVLASAGIILAVKNRKDILEALSKYEHITKPSALKTPATPASNNIFDKSTGFNSSDTQQDQIVSVHEHVRNLPINWRPSPDKVIAALENGFDLGENQTWVCTYEKKCA